MNTVYRIDLWAFKLTRHISVFLNFLTGKPSAEFFNFFNGMFMVCFIVASAVSTVVEQEDPSIGTHLWTAIALAAGAFLWYTARITKENIEADITRVINTAMDRVIPVMLFIWTIVAVAVPPWYWSTFLASAAWGARAYGHYCYLHNLPPREPAHSRLKNWVKDKVRNFAPQPTRLPSPA